MRLSCVTPHADGAPIIRQELAPGMYSWVSGYPQGVITPEDDERRCENMGSKKTSIKIGRDARNGRFVTVEEAKRRPATAVVERIKRP